jgi:CRISPR/Cas system Type II protein with McrA/HNH and RuvC-like nuclease domain
MSELGIKISELRAKGYTYKEITKELGCDKSTVCYHVGLGQKAKAASRIKIRRANNPLIRKIERYKARKGLYNKILGFNTRDNTAKRKKNLTLCSTENFSIKELSDKVGDSPVCYLTGHKIDLQEPNSYSFDHIVPVSKGGTNSLDNLGLTTKQANQAKSDMSLPEFINLCKTVLRHQKANKVKNDKNCKTS